jgi:hypothetical protein
MRPPRRHAAGLAGLEKHVLLRLLQVDADRAFEHVERILHVAVVMPRHLLRWRNPQLVDPEPRARRVLRLVLDLVEMTAVLELFHHRPR